MFAVDSTYVGVEPASPEKSFTYAALDKDLNLVALADGDFEDAIAFLSGRKSAAVAINSPAGVNRGLVRKQNAAVLKKTRGAEFRLAEHELRARGIRVAGVPAKEELCPAWMRSGFALYRALAQLGFEKFPAARAERLMLETHPHACYCAISGQIPLPQSSLEGRLQRQLILYERGLRIKDPMNFFEELTRHKMMRGIFPMELLYQPEQLDALAAAYTAWLAVNKPERTFSVGDEREGCIILPEKELKETY